jgi:hypothetical protein
MRLTGIKANRPMKLVTDENGRTRAVVDQKKIEAKLDVSTRLQKRKSRKIKVSRNPRLREG